MVLNGSNGGVPMDPTTPTDLISYSKYIIYDRFIFVLSFSASGNDNDI